MWKEIAKELPKDGEKCLIGMIANGIIRPRASTIVQYESTGGCWYSSETGDSMFTAYPPHYWMSWDEIVNMLKTKVT